MLASVYTIIANKPNTMAAQKDTLEAEATGSVDTSGDGVGGSELTGRMIVSVV